MVEELAKKTGGIVTEIPRSDGSSTSGVVVGFADMNGSYIGNDDCSSHYFCLLPNQDWQKVDSTVVYKIVRTKDLPSVTSFEDNSFLWRANPSSLHRFMLEERKGLEMRRLNIELEYLAWCQQIFP